MRIALAIIMLIFWAQASTYDSLILQIQQDHARRKLDFEKLHRGMQYNWEFVKTTGLPLWCRDDSENNGCGEIIENDIHGPIMRVTDHGVYITVRSWVSGKNEHLQMVRQFLYVQNSLGTWKSVKSQRIIDCWDEELAWAGQMH